MRLWTGVKIERDAGVEMNAVERARDCLLGRRQTVAVSADGAGEDNGEAVRTVFEVVQRLGIGRGCIGKIEALHDRPRRGRRARGNGLRRNPSAVERLDAERIIGLGDEAGFEGRAFEHVLHQLAPLLARGGGKLGSERQVVGIGHDHKMPRCERPANRARLQPRTLGRRSCARRQLLDAACIQLR